MGADTPKESFKEGFYRCMRAQDWVLVPIFIGFGIAMYLANKEKPYQRPVYIYDATISFPYHEDTIAPWLAPFVPFCILIITMLPFELIIFKREGTPWSIAVARIFRVFGSFVTMLCVVGFFTELFKIQAGRLRPDLLARCKPTVDPDLADQDLQYGTYNQVPCDPTVDKEFLEDAHKSFPSGHSSWSFASGWFVAAYMAWCTLWRNGGHMHDLLFKVWNKQSRTFGNDAGFLHRMCGEAASTLIFLLMLLCLAWPWGVGISRFRDNHHNPSDIVGGFVLGFTFVFFFFLRLLSVHAYWEPPNGAEIEFVRRLMEKQGAYGMSASQELQMVQPICAGGGAASGYASSNAASAGLGHDLEAGLKDPRVPYDAATNGSGAAAAGAATDGVGAAVDGAGAELAPARSALERVETVTHRG